MIHRIALMAAALALAQAALAATYVVAEGGSDSDPGSEQQPFATLQKIVDVVGPGDTVLIRTGVYPGWLDMPISGASGQPITIRNYPGEHPIIEGRVDLWAGWGVPIGWIVVEGLEIRNVCCDYDYGLQIHNAHDIVIRRNVIHHNGSTGMRGDGLRVLIDGNVVYAHGLPGPSGPGALIPGVAVNGSDFTIINNIFHSNTDSGLTGGGPVWNPAGPNSPSGPEYSHSYNWVISNNVFAYAVERPGITIWQTEAKGSIIQNNIFFENANGPSWCCGNGVSFYNSGNGHVIRNNLFFGQRTMNVSDSAGGTSFTETGSMIGDPFFFNPSAFDFRLVAGSPAIDSGLAALAPDHDFHGLARPAGSAVDLGPFEFGATSPPGGPCAQNAQCNTGFCASGVCCNRACDGPCEVCAVSAGAPTDGVCGLRPDGAICRGPRGPCDAVERCDGASPLCPSDRLQTAGATGVPRCAAPTRCGGYSVECGCTSDLHCRASQVCLAGQCRSWARDGIGESSCRQQTGVTAGEATLLFAALAALRRRRSW